jgi:hypothetical protein
MELSYCKRFEALRVAFYCCQRVHDEYSQFQDDLLAVKDSILQHQVKFVISTTATATPSWQLTRVTVNQRGIS